MKKLALTFVIILLVASFLTIYVMSYMPISSTQHNNSWLDRAKRAWEYFQPWKGLEVNTGLHHAGLYWPYFTDWDLGIYIQAIIDAEKLGILSKSGAWGADDRLEKILRFLENRELTINGLPYLWYDSRTGRKYGESPTNAADTGKLLVALGNLKLHRPDLAERINKVVYEKTKYEPLCKVVDSLKRSTNIYDYYVASGFAYFWPEKHAPIAESIINNIVSSPKVETYGVKLPKSKILSEVLLHAIFDLKPDKRLLELAKQVYLAHEARYNATGKYTAFSEGNTDLDNPTYVYEWVILPDGRTWVVKDHMDNDVRIAPIIYYKVAVGFLAIYNTEFARSMVNYIEAKLPEPTHGYMDGIDENGRLVKTIIDKTNGLIISAARYAMRALDLSNFPWPFIQDGIVNNTLIVIGESKPRGPVGAAHTLDTLGGMLITKMLARESSSGELKAAIDGWLVKYDSSSRNITLLDKLSNLIIIGSPGINILSYYYNNSRDSLGKLLAPVLFIINHTGGYNYLYIPTSGSIYKMEFDKQGGLIADYGAIMIFKDQFGRYVALVYGIGAEGTRIACEVLRDYNLWTLRGKAVIVKFYSDKLGEYPSKVSIIEVIS